jgi:hypothetical protein
MFVEDLTVFMNPAEMGTSAELDGEPVTGIFDNGYDEQSIAMGVAGTAPMYTLPSSAVPSDVIGMAVVIDDTTYKVVESMPDGTGVTRLQLRT